MSSARKGLLILAAVVASLSVVVVASWVSSGHNSSRSDSAAGTWVPHGTPPNVTFAPGASSGNREVDAFVDNFIGLCRRGEYEQYRLCWTAYGTPVSGERFAAMWKFARKVVITQILPVSETVKVMHPAYVVKATVELDPKAKVATKEVEVMVQWEENRWAIAPAPRLEPESTLDSVTETAPASQAATPPAGHG